MEDFPAIRRIYKESEAASFERTLFKGISKAFDGSRHSA
jgi:hypothetical protein